MAEYASEHVGFLEGEKTFLTHMVGYSGKRLTKGHIRNAREKIREEFNEWLDEDNPDGAINLMEMAGFSETTIRAYVQSVRDRLDGKVRMNKSAVAPDKYSGIRQHGDRYEARVQLPAHGLNIGLGRFDTAYEAALARDKKLIELEMRHVRLNILSWDNE